MPCTVAVSYAPCWKKHAHCNPAIILPVMQRLSKRLTCSTQLNFAHAAALNVNRKKLQALVCIKRQIESASEVSVGTV